MSIRPVDMNGVIQRTQDVGTLKQHQDMKPMVDQQNIQIEVQREEYRQSEQVTRKDDSQMEEHRFDAKEEGKGQYQRQEQRKKKQKEGRKDGYKRKSFAQLVLWTLSDWSDGWSASMRVYHQHRFSGDQRKSNRCHQYAQGQLYMGID